MTGGFICAKVRKFGEVVYGEDRLRYPAVRKGRKGDGKFKRVTWDEALELVAGKMRAAKASHGGASILPYSYGGSNGLLTQDNIDAQLWRRFGTSRLARTVCAAPTSAANMALYGKMPSVTYQDYPEARLIILWGVNPSASGIHLVPYVREAQARGAKLVVVDPRSTPLARAADVHLAVKPGTDVTVALAIHNGFADETFLRDHTRGADRLRERAERWTFAHAAEAAGIEAAAIEQVARLYAESSPALVRCGWGLERNRNGGNAAMAVLSLPAVGGKFGVRGGGYSMSNSASWKIERPWIAADEPATRLVNMNHLGRALTDYNDPPVDVLFVYNCNPVATVPDQHHIVRGLQREDLFTVVFDQVMTDTAFYADVVLPATTFLEGYDFAKAYGPIHLSLARPVIDVVGEARSNADVFGDLAARLEVLGDSEPIGELDLLVKVLDSLPGSVGADLRSDVAPTAPCGPAPVQFVDVFPNTPDGKVNLFPAEYDTEAPLGLYAFQPDPERADDQLDARPAAAARRQAGHASRGCGHTRAGGRRSRADFQRPRRGALPASSRAVDPARHGEPAERTVAAQHAQRRDGDSAGSRDADRYCRRRVLQRRAGAGRVPCDGLAAGITSPAGGRTPAGAPTLPRRRSLPCVSRRAPGLLSARASGGTR